MKSLERDHRPRQVTCSSPEIHHCHSFMAKQAPGENADAPGKCDAKPIPVIPPQVQVIGHDLETERDRPWGHKESDTTEQLNNSNPQSPL